MTQPSPPPAIVVRLEFEQRGRLFMEAETPEDAQRLLLWLRHSAVWRELPDRLDWALDRLEERWVA